MSDIAQRIDAAGIGDLLVSQWSNAPRLRALTDSLLAFIDQEFVGPLTQLERQVRIETAEGIWLDLIGERLGRARPWIRSADFIRFGFDGSGGVGFDQGAFDSASSGLAGREPIGDEYYRDILLVQQQALLVEDSLGTIEPMVQAGFPAVHVRDNLDMTFNIEGTSMEDRQNIVAILQTFMIAAAPAGVTVSVDP